MNLEEGEIFVWIEFIDRGTDNLPHDSKQLVGKMSKKKYDLILALVEEEVEA